MVGDLLVLHCAENLGLKLVDWEHVKFKINFSIVHYADAVGLGRPVQAQAFINSL